MQTFHIELIFKNAQGGVGGDYRANKIEEALALAMNDATSFNGKPKIRVQGPDNRWYTFKRAKQLWYNFEFGAKS